MKWYERIMYFQVMLVITTVLNMIWAFPIMWAWNYVMPYLFGLPQLNWLRAWLLLFILTSLWKLHLVETDKIKD